MSGREKVIKELESLRDICNAKSNMAIGKGKVAWAGYANTADDALALLREQEPVKPIERSGFWYCGNCRYVLMNHQKFCIDCGQEVKWE